MFKNFFSVLLLSTISFVALAEDVVNENQAKETASEKAEANFSFECSKSPEFQKLVDSLSDEAKADFNKFVDSIETQLKENANSWNGMMVRGGKSMSKITVDFSVEDEKSAGPAPEVALTRSLTEEQAEVCEAANEEFLAALKIFASDKFEGKIENCIFAKELKAKDEKLTIVATLIVS